MLPASRSLLLALLPVLPLAGADQASDKFDGLLRNSPFGHSPVNAAVADGTYDSLEFRGVVVEDSGSYFSIYDPAKRRSVWIKQNDLVNDLLINGYDRTRESLSATYQGRPVTLTLKRSVIIVQAAPQRVPVVATMIFTTTPSADPSTDRQRQLVIEELRRRRALREQAIAIRAVR